MARQMLIKRLRGIGKIHRGALEKFTEGHRNIFRLISNFSKLVRLPKNPSTAKSLMSAKQNHLLLARVSKVDALIDTAQRRSTLNGFVLITDFWTLRAL